MHNKSSAHPTPSALEPPRALRCSEECLLSNAQKCVTKFLSGQFWYHFGNSQWGTLPDLPWIRGNLWIFTPALGLSWRRPQILRPVWDTGKIYLIIRHSFQNPAHTRCVALPGHWVGYFIFQNFLFDLVLSIHNCFVFAFLSVL